MRYIRYIEQMSDTKSATLNLRINPGLKEALRIAAARDHRSFANLVEIFIIRHCQETGITIPEQYELFQADGQKDG